MTPNHELVRRVETCTCAGGGYPTRSGHAFSCPRRPIVDGLIAQANIDEAMDRASVYDETEDVVKEDTGRRRRLAIDAPYRQAALRRAGA